MKQLFVLIYCLPIGHILLLVALLSLLFRFLVSHFNQYRLFRALCLLALGIWFLGLLYTTVGSRTGGEPTGYQLIPFHSYREVLAGGTQEILRSNFMNTLLFYPAGLLASTTIPVKKKLPILITLALILMASAAIEDIQYHLCLGYGEIDDIIHNTLGGFLGLSVGMIGKPAS